MFKKLLLVFILVPLLEIYILVKIGEYLGAEGTIGLILLTGVLGAFFVRMQGFSLIKKIQGDLREGRMPHQRLLEGVCILAAGLLMITPGLLTDLTGFLLLVPAVRKILIEKIIATARIYTGGGGEVSYKWNYGKKWGVPKRTQLSPTTESNNNKTEGED